MVKKTQLKHNEALDIVYSVITKLRSSGRKQLTVTEVAKLSGVSRSTVNSQKDPDWLEVREVILNNKPSHRVKLVQAEVKEQTKWQVEAAKLQSLLEDCEKELDKLIQKADEEFVKLFEQLHKYLYVAKMIPSKMDRASKILIENQELKKQLELISAENRKLKALSPLSAGLVPFVKQNIINVYSADQKINLIKWDLLALAADAMYKLDSYFESPLPPKVIYILCGNFASGKSTWIKEHKPQFQESVSILYFDGTNHTEAMRKTIVRYIMHLMNKYSVNCKIVCVRLISDLGQCLERNTHINRVRNKTTVSEELIKTLEKHFEEVSFKEGFNEIILDGGANGNG